MLILEPIENFNLDLDGLLSNVFDEFLLFLKKNDYNALHESENFEKKAVKRNSYSEIWTTINDNHAFCMYCNDHLYCYSDFADMNSFFQRHINTEYHKSCRLLNPLPSKMPMFTWEVEGIVGHCNVCKISGLEVIVFDTESNIPDIRRKHICDKKEKSSILNLLKIFCSLNLFVQKFIISLQGYSVCALCNVILQEDEPEKIHFVSQPHFHNFLNFIYGKFKFEIKDLLNGFNMEKLIRYILIHKVVFNSVDMVKDKFTKQNCLHQSNQSLLYTNIPCYLQFVPKVIQNSLDFNPDDVIVGDHCLLCQEFNIQPDHALSVSHVKNLGKGIDVIKRSKNYEKYLAVVSTRLQLFAEYMENYNVYKSYSSRTDATLKKESKDSTSAENCNSPGKKPISRLVEVKCENGIKNDESKIPVKQNDVSSVPLMTDKARATTTIQPEPTKSHQLGPAHNEIETTEKNKRKVRREVKKDKNSTPVKNVNSTNKGVKVSKCVDSNERVEFECFDDGEKTAQKNDSKKYFYRRKYFPNRHKYRYKNNEKNYIKKDELPLFVTKMKKEGDSEARREYEKTMKNRDLSVRTSLQNQIDRVEDIINKLFTTFNIKEEEKTYELEAKNLTSTSTRLTGNGSKKRRNRRRKPDSKPKIDVQQNQVNVNSSTITGNITGKTSQKSAGSSKTKQSLKTDEVIQSNNTEEFESNEKKKNKKTKSYVTKTNDVKNPNLPDVSKNKQKTKIPENKMNAECLNYVMNVADFMNEMTKKIELVSTKESRRESTLCNKIMLILCTIFPKCECYVFGSRITGLSFETSDLDVFFDCGDAYEKSSYLSTKKDVTALARKVYKILKRKNLFTEFNIVHRARVPLVSFFDAQTQLKCDLSFTNGLSVENSLALKFLISLDWRVRIVILAVKKWAILNNLHGRPMFSSYALALMTIFYLQQLPSPILPPIETLQKNYRGFRRTFNGWDCNINKDPTQLPKTENSDSPKVLLKGFFEYYKSFDYVDFIISPLTGQPLPKKAYKSNFTSLPMAYKRHFHNVHFRSIEKENSIIWCVDPFNLGHIVTGQFPTLKFQSFLVFCQKSFELIT